MNIILNRSKRFCGYLVGIVFFISGVLKLLDPTGTSMIVDEYYKFMHLDFLSFSAKPVAVVVSMAESLIGAALITGVWRRITAMATLTAMGVFMLISMALLIFNPVMDCGCFGEAVHLTHAQTFVKNLILSVLSCMSFFPFSALDLRRKSTSECWLRRLPRNYQMGFQIVDIYMLLLEPAKTLHLLENCKKCSVGWIR